MWSAGTDITEDQEVPKQGGKLRRWNVALMTSPVLSLLFQVKTSAIKQAFCFEMLANRRVQNEFYKHKLKVTSMQ